LVVHRRHPSDSRYILIEPSAKVASDAPVALVAHHASIRVLVAGISS
jgi:hypothetical protein